MRMWAVHYTGPQDTFISADSSIEAEIEAAERYHDNWIATEVEDEIEQEAYQEFVVKPHDPVSDIG